MKDLIKKYLVQDVTSKWSFRIAGVAAVVAGLSEIVPELKAALPESWMPWVILAIAVARVIKQEGKE